MQKPDIAIIDYQMGNLRSVQKAFEHVGIAATVTSDPEQIDAARRVVLPGVGAFGDAMRELQSRHLVAPIQAAIAQGKPFLGICLGLQLLFETGHEGGVHQGLGILKGEVVRFAPQAGLKIPHMGWNRVAQHIPHAPLFGGVPSDAYFYFVHSYYVKPADASVDWLGCDYGGQFCAAVWRDNLFATQFHPEKSQSNGLMLLKNFSQL